nr:leucine-rich repeat extensin-like protein 3 [Ipomoea batatas]
MEKWSHLAATGRDDRLTASSETHGKATKIFIFIVTVLVVTGLVLGFGLLRHRTHKETNKSCYGDSCNPITSNPDPQASPIVIPNPSPNPPPITASPSSSNPITQLPPPPPSSDNPNSAPPPPPLPPQLPDTQPPPPQPQDTQPPPPPAVSAPPPTLSPPGAALVASGPVHS